MPEQAELQRKTGQRGLLIASYKRFKKDSDGAITPVVKTVCVPAHLVPPGSPQAKQLHHLHAQLSLGEELPQANKKRVLCFCVQDRFGPVWLFATLYAVACQASLSGRDVLQVRILEHIGQYWLPYTSRALYYLLP